MSNTDATFTQATHALTIIGQQNPSKEGLQRLYDGYLPALVKASEKDSLPSLVNFKKFLGLAALPTVTSDGRTGADFVRTMTEKRYNLSDWAKDVLAKEAFDASVTSGVTYTPEVILGSEFSDSERTTENIRAEAARRNYVTPPAELAPLLREAFTDEELRAMGLYWLVVMHEPIVDSVGSPDLLGLGRDGGGRRLNADWGDPSRRWLRVDGFVFLAPTES